MKITLYPSRADRWVPCPRSASLENDFANEQGKAGREGTVAHKVAEDMAAGKPVKPGDDGAHGIKITDDMIEGAYMLVDMLPIHDKDYECYVEHWIDMHSLGRKVATKIDFYAIRRFPTPEVFVFDYKYGFSQIEPSSWQFKQYCAAITEHHNLPLNTQFHITIVQPRGWHHKGPIRTESYTGSDVHHWLVEMQRSAELAELGENAPANTGPQCKNCNGRHACSALTAAAYNVFDETMREAPAILTADQYGQELAIISRALEILKARATGIEQLILTGLRSGQQVRGWHIVHGQRNRQWTLTDEQLFAWGDAMGKDLRSKPTPVTPAEAERRGVPKETVDAYVNRPPGEAKLVRTTAEYVSAIFKQP